MTHDLEQVLERVKTWPESRQQDAADMLKVMEKSGIEIYKLSDAERQAIDEGLGSDVVSAEEMETFWKGKGL